MRYFIHLGFDGTEYSGWQRQKDTPNTLQEVIENTLTQLFKKKISVYGCGRTDAGVHASQYIVQFYLDKAPLFDLKFRLNKNLPSDIAVFDVIKVKENQHVRHDAVARTYDYFIHWDKDPALVRYSSFYDDANLDIHQMRKAAALIQRNTDFKALCKQPESYENTLCAISNCEVFINPEQGRLRVSITSNRFLRGMVRICVFFLMQVGSKKMTLDEFAEILNQKKELNGKWPAHPNGLFLSKVEYPFLKLNDSHNLIKMLKLGLT